MKISAVMPIHNEGKYLPYSLKNMLIAPLDELIFILDRCTDNSEQIIKKFSKITSYSTVILEKKDQKWRCPTAENYEIGFELAKMDVIFSLAGDCIYDPTIFNSKHFSDADLVSFMYWNLNLFSPLHIHEWYENFLKTHFNLTHLWEGELGYRSGIFGIKRPVWRQLHFKDVPSEYDDLMRRVIKKNYTYKFMKEVKNYHLRAGLIQGRQELQGVSRAQNIDRYPLWKVITHSLLHFKPYVLTSYLRERKYHIYKRRKWSKEGLT